MGVVGVREWVMEEVRKENMRVRGVRGRRVGTDLGME